jgi:hypothetical protein
MRRSAVVVVLSALTVGACGGGEPAFDDAMVRDIGTGSVAIKGLQSTVRSSLKFNESFNNDERLQKSAALLFNGQLDQMSAADRARLTRVSKLSRAREATLLRQWGDVERRIGAARVNADAHGDVSAGARKFVVAWNAYLQGNAERAADMRAFVRKGAASTAGFDALLAAAATAVRTRDTRRFVMLRDRMLDDTRDVANDMDSDFQRFSAVSPADKTLVNTLNSNSEARAVATAVNDKYPNGYLAYLMGDDSP